MILMVFNFHTQLLRLRTYARSSIDANEAPRMTNGILLIYFFKADSCLDTKLHLGNKEQMMSLEEQYGNSNKMIFQALE